MFIWFTRNGHCCLLGPPPPPPANILERTLKTGAYRALLKESLKDLSALDSFSSDRYFTAERRYGFGKLDLLSFTQDRRVWAEECIARANIKKECEKRKYKFILEKRPNTDIIGDSK